MLFDHIIQTIHYFETIMKKKKTPLTFRLFILEKYS